MPKGFRGGVVLSHLQEKKEDAWGCVTRRLSPQAIYLSLRQNHTMLAPCVHPGDTVRVGDRVAEDPMGVVPPLHSGVSGRVMAVDAFHPAADGGEAPTVIIENDGNDTVGDLLPPLSDDAEPAAIVQRMYDAGLVGMGGGGFPTYCKYRDAAAQWLLINGCECEPYLAADVRSCMEQSALIGEGVRFLARAVGVTEDHIRLCAESAAAVEALRTTGLPVIPLPKRYPQGGERQLTQAVLGIRVPERKLPLHCGVMVSNIGTAAAMGDAARGLPLTHRTLTVSGQVEQPVNVLIPIGTPFEEAAAQVTPPEGRVRYIAGGPMTGRRLTSLKAGIPKTCGGLILLEARSFEETPCIRCGACARVCPSTLMPFLIDAAALAEDRDRCRELRAAACISCGCCSYVCPARRQLAARITAVKTQTKT